MIKRLKKEIGFCISYLFIFWFYLDYLHLIGPLARSFYIELSFCQTLNTLEDKHPQNQIYNIHCFQLTEYCFRCISSYWVKIWDMCSEVWRWTNVTIVMQANVIGTYASLSRSDLLFVNSSRSLEKWIMPLIQKKWV